MILSRRPSGTSARVCKLHLLCEVDIHPVTIGDDLIPMLTATGERQVDDLAEDLRAEIGDSTVKLWCIGESYHELTSGHLAACLETEVAHSEDWQDGHNSLTHMERTRPRGRPRFPRLGQLAQLGGMPGHVVLVTTCPAITYVRRLAGHRIVADRFSTTNAQGQLYSLTLDTLGHIGTPPPESQ